MGLSYAHAIRTLHRLSIPKGDKNTTTSLLVVNNSNRELVGMRQTAVVLPHQAWRSSRTAPTTRRLSNDKLANTQRY